MKLDTNVTSKECGKTQHDDCSWGNCGCICHNGETGSVFFNGGQIGAVTNFNYTTATTIPQIQTTNATYYNNTFLEQQLATTLNADTLRQLYGP